MIWYIEDAGKPKKIPEEVLKYKIENYEVSGDKLVVNEKIKNWIPLRETQIWKEYRKKDGGSNFEKESIESHMWHCEKCGNMISAEPCPYCSDAQTVVNTNTAGYESDVGTAPAFVAKNKRNHRTLITILVIALVAIIAIIQLNSIRRDNGSLVGEWILDNNSSITFYENGTALWKTDVGTRTFEWNANENVMIWYFNGAPYKYTYEVTNDVLYVDGEYYAMRQR